MLAGLPERARVVLIGVVSAALAFFVFGGLRLGGPVRAPLDAVPRDSFLVATVDVAELRRSPLYGVLFGEPGANVGPRGAPAALGAHALGMGNLADACGFDPLTRVERLALGVPEEGKGELGVAARVDVTRDELARCAESLAAGRGGHVATKEVGSFTVVEDRAGADEAARPRLAYGRGGLLVVGRGAWFDAMLAAADGKAPSAREADAHAAIRASLTSRDGWRSPTVLVSAQLPKALRDRLRKEMAAEVEGAPGPEQIMSGVLGVSSAGVALRAGASGGTTDLAVELTCESEPGCASVEDLLRKSRLEWSKQLMLRMVGLGPLLDSIEITRVGPRIRVTAGAPSSALAASLDRVLRFSAGARDRAEPAPPVVPPVPPAASSGRGETIPAPRSSK